MHLVRMRLGDVPPFTEPVTFKFDQRVNVFVGPNASGKSTVLQMLAHCLIGPDENSKRPISQGHSASQLILVSDDAFDKLACKDPDKFRPPNFLSASEDWFTTTGKTITPPEKPPAVQIDSVRVGLPGISGLEDPGAYGETAAEILKGPFSGSRTMCALELLGKELRHPDADESTRGARVILMDMTELADACSKYVCEEVIEEARSHNYIPGPDVRGYLAHPQADVNNITVLRSMGIKTNDIRNFKELSIWEEPSYSAYTEDAGSVPIYLGHLSSGTEGTLLWIRWLGLKMVNHYEFEDGWQQKPAILLIDEIENHLHPTWQRRVIPALLEHFPGLQIFATTHSPFVVAGLQAGQVHLLERDEEGRVTAKTNPEDVIGWTADEILRNMMGVDDPTDKDTAEAAQELRELRNQGPENSEEAEAERQRLMQELRQRVNRDLLAGGPMAAQRELFEEHLTEILEEHRRSESLNQDGG